MISIHPWELLAAAGIFLFTLFCLNRILFRPFLQVERERQRRTTGQFEESERLLHQCQQLTIEYETKIRDEKFENYRRQEKFRNEALARRAEAVAEARKKADKIVTDARQEISGQLEKVKETVQPAAREIAAAITRALLGREIR